MLPLRTDAAPRSPAMVGEGFGIDHTRGNLTGMAAWTVGAFSLLFLVAAIARGETLPSIVSVVGLVVALALWDTARQVKTDLRAARRRALDVELAWVTHQRVEIRGYRAYLTGARPVFDVVLARSGYERQIIDELRRLDARILTSAESQRVRVEIPPRKVALRVEDTAPIDAPDLDLMKRAIATVSTVDVELHIEMGSHP